MDAIGKWFILEALFFTDSSTDSIVLDDLYSPRSLDNLDLIDFNHEAKTIVNF